ncbi:inner centromere protein-like isoform X2 [Anopheles bellator]|uniref:inner centromere protein-like isoform X2 n=1 Tax=Anopheles bellator TaxID=139047 RepID=UPI0026496C35|nr:inner centromere protein-like isoform X2 [Anopheles bellator]
MDVPVDAMEMALPPIESFKNCEYHVRVSGTTELDRRVMSFVDNLWGFEVTGGVDQFEPLTVISVKREGLARRAGIRVNDIITKINETHADKLTLAQAQELIAESGRTVKIFVSGEVEEDSEDEMTVDFWFKPLGDADRAMLDWEARLRANRNPGKWNGLWPWNDRRKCVYKESNCYLVPSVSEEKREREMKLRATEDQYEKHLQREREEAEKKAEEQRKIDEARREEEERRAEEDRFLTAFEEEQKKRQEQEAAPRLQSEAIEPEQVPADADADRYIDELMEQEKDLGEVSTDMIEPDDSGTGEV